MMDRREFFTRCAVLLGSVALPIGCGQSGGGSDATDNFSLPDLNRSRFDAAVSTTFSVSHASFGAIDMTLVQVDDEIFSPDTDQFSIALSGPDQPPFEEGTYRMYNDTLGYIDLYLQPGKASGGRQNYRAVFSLLQA